MEIRRVFLKLLRFIPILLLVAVVNFYVDPSQLFGNGRYERQMAEIMLAGENVANATNFEHRLVQKFYLESIATAPDIIVLGSSRGMLIRESDFPGRSLFNANVAGASIEDYIAAGQLLAERDALPEKIFLEMSPWVFNINNEQSRWNIVAEEYFAGLESLGVSYSALDRLKAPDMERYAQLFSLPYLQDSLRWLGRTQAFYATNDLRTGEAMELSDGSRVYDATSEALNVKEVAAIVRESLQAPYSMQNFSELDPGLVALFETQLRAWKAAGVEVAIVLVPYHPNYYAALVGDPDNDIILEVEDYIRRLALFEDFLVVGGYDPAMVTCTAEEYYDGLHPRESCIQKLLMKKKRV